MVPDEIREVLSTRQNQPDRIQEILDFFSDSSLNWIWHPAWQNIFDKRDLAVLKNLPTAGQHYVETIQRSLWSIFPKISRWSWGCKSVNSQGARQVFCTTMFHPTALSGQKAF
jgi:hypothetical protein